MVEFTNNLKLEKPDFNISTWHDAVNGNFDIIDITLGYLNIVIQGSWANSTAYAVDDFVIDPNDLSVYKCLVAHTSAAAGLFATDRAANPTFWLVTSLSVKASVASPTFTGVPSAPTAAPGTNTTQLATTGFVTAAFTALKNGVAAAFDTLAEIATELALKAPISGLTGRNEVWFDASMGYPHQTVGAAGGVRYMTTNAEALFYYGFDTTVAETVYFRWIPPKRWNLGALTMQPYWTAASGSGTVQFIFKGVAASNDDTLDVALGTGQTSLDTLLAVNDVHIGPETAALTVAGSPIDADYVWISVTRDVANDTHSADAQLLGFKLFYTSDQINDA